MWELFINEMSVKQQLHENTTNNATNKSTQVQ